MEHRTPASTHGKLIVVSGPSGAGKTTVVRRLFEECPLPLVASVSATTRAPRKGEVDGVDYHFLDAEEFERRRRRGELLECCNVYGRGYWYGTLRSEVTAGLSADKWVVLEIDVEGTRVLLQEYPDATTIFVRPGSPEELERRLRTRGTETADAIERRLEVARRELAMAGEYQHEVINDDVACAVRQICDILLDRGG